MGRGGGAVASVSAGYDRVIRATPCGGVIERPAPLLPWDEIEVGAGRVPVGSAARGGNSGGSNTSAGCSRDTSGAG